LVVHPGPAAAPEIRTVEVAGGIRVCAVVRHPPGRFNGVIRIATRAVPRHGYELVEALVVGYLSDSRFRRRSIRAPRRRYQFRHDAARRRRQGCRRQEGQRRRRNYLPHAYAPFLYTITYSVIFTTSNSNSLGSKSQTKKRRRRRRAIRCRPGAVAERGSS
jgi:hypothetical protein